MSWGTTYTYEGYLSGVRKSEIDCAIKEANKSNDIMWQTILAYMMQTPPATMKYDNGSSEPWPEYIVEVLNDLREEIESNNFKVSRCLDCLEALKDNPDSVKEG